MHVRVVRWPHSVPPTDSELRAVYQAEGLAPYAWSNGPHDRYAEHEHGYHKVLYCVAGSVEMTIAGSLYELHPGDRLDLPAHTRHSAIVGPEGVICLEGHRTT